MFKDGTYIYNDDGSGYGTNTKTYFETIKQIVYSGIAVISIPNNFGPKKKFQLYDDDPYLPGKYKPSIDGPHSNYSLYWNKGNNFLTDYLKELMYYIYNDDILDYNRCGMMGYSLGAQIVSRMYNEFPTMKLKFNNIDFPNISCGIMIAGGTLYCYDDDNPNFCPKNKTEPIYDKGIKKWDEHPPTLLSQNIPDIYADKYATRNYFNTLAKNGVPSYLINKILTPKSGKHAIAACNNKWNSKSSENDVTLISIILFLLKYL